MWLTNFHSNVTANSLFSGEFWIGIGSIDQHPIIQNILRFRCFISPKRRWFDSKILNNRPLCSPECQRNGTTISIFSCTSLKKRPPRLSHRKKHCYQRPLNFIYRRLTVYLAVSLDPSGTMSINDEIWSSHDKPWCLILNPKHNQHHKKVHQSDNYRPG